jgi:hypothetical protein
MDGFTTDARVRSVWAAVNLAIEDTLFHDTEVGISDGHVKVILPSCRNYCLLE